MIPVQMSMPKSSRASCAARQTRHTMTASTASSGAEPTKPSCSPTAVKMKSVLLLGHDVEPGLRARRTGPCRHSRRSRWRAWPARGCSAVPCDASTVDAWSWSTNVVSRSFW